MAVHWVEERRLEEGFCRAVGPAVGGGLLEEGICRAPPEADPAGKFSASHLVQGP